jgi:hypothetical protein
VKKWRQRHFFAFVCVLLDVTPLFYACVCVFMGATQLFHFCVCVNGCNVTFLRVCKKWRYTHYHTHKREQVALHPLTHTQTWKSGVTPINTHTNVNKWRYTHKHTHTRATPLFYACVCVFMGVTPLVHVCVCVNGCNATFSRLCPLTHTQTWTSGVTPINTHTHA